MGVGDLSMLIDQHIFIDFIYKHNNVFICCLVEGSGLEPLLASFNVLERGPGLVNEVEPGVLASTLTFQSSLGQVVVLVTEIFGGGSAGTPETLTVFELLKILKADGDALASVHIVREEVDGSTAPASAVHFVRIQDLVQILVDDARLAVSLSVEEHRVLVALFVTLEVAIAEREFEALGHLTAPFGYANLLSLFDSILDLLESRLVGLGDDEGDAVLLVVVSFGNGCRFEDVHIAETYLAGNNFSRIVVCHKALSLNLLLQI